MSDDGYSNQTLPTHETVVLKTEADLVKEKRKETLISSLFLLSLTGVSTVGGFGLSLARARKKDPTAFEQGLMPGSHSLRSLLATLS